jgi:hypothetical protein
LEKPQPPWMRKFDPQFLGVGRTTPRPPDRCGVVFRLVR